jgi:hypothetical protein
MDFKLVFVIPNQVLNLIQDLRFRDLGLRFREFRFQTHPCGQGSLFGWVYLFCFRLADTEIRKLDLRLLGKH